MVDTQRITSDSVADLIFHLKWKSGVALHTDGYQASRVNLWRDLLPPELLNALMNKASGDRLQVPLEDGKVVTAFTNQNFFDIQGTQFDCRFRKGMVTEPRLGLFYPKGMLRGIAGIFRANVQPFRCVGLSNGHMTVDFNHPLAGKDLDLSVVIGTVGVKSAKRGGTSIDWMEVLTTGPGMQARWQNQQTDFFSAEAFGRDDETPDTRFYSVPRLVRHLDDTAIEMVRNTYGRFLKNDLDILDLMSSWQSHIPDRLKFARLVGLGLNDRELKINTRLSEHVVHDLNLNPRLPFDSDSFDTVVCTVSVEYLANPLAVYEEVARVLRKDGYFIVTFSNRWFPTKAIRIWKELHEFERMGMVLEYFIRSGGFKNLQTYSFRGLPRPHDDKYFPDMRYSDPVYAVWGQKRQSNCANNSIG